MASARIIVAAHKNYRMPDDPLYLPLHVGAEGKTDGQGRPLDLGYTRDNTGDNISAKNPSYCELTGLYWAWKNLQEDYIGLVHYRRYFAHPGKQGRNPLEPALLMVSKPFEKQTDPFGQILTSEELQVMLKDYDVFVPGKRNYYIETIYSHYAHTHYPEHLIETRRILLDKYPAYVTSYDKVLNSRKACMFNMMIMRRDLLERYCQWLFSVLFELENRLKAHGAEGAEDLSAYQQRLYGRVSEILLNVWLDYQIRTGAISKKRIRELPCIYMENVDWIRKGTSFLKAKFFHKKYESSF